MVKPLYINIVWAVLGTLFSVNELFNILPHLGEGGCDATSIPSLVWVFAILVASLTVLIPRAFAVHLFRYVFATLVFTEIYAFYLTIYYRSFDISMLLWMTMLLVVACLGLIYFHLKSTTDHFRFPSSFNLWSYVISGFLGIMTLVMIDVLDAIFCPEPNPFIYFEF